MKTTQLLPSRDPSDERVPRRAARSHRTRRWWAAVLTIALVVAAGSAATLVLFWPGGTGSKSGPVDMDGKLVTLDPGDTLTPEAQEKQNATADGYGRFQVPSIGLDVPLGALSEVEGQITPPGFTSVYWIRNRGTAPSRAQAGTVYVATHALRWGGRAPGNYLIDVEHGTATIGAGTKVIADGVSYTVTGSRAIDKQRLRSDPDVWADTPNRLVIITCLQVPAQTPAVSNMVITAIRSP